MQTKNYSKLLEHLAKLFYAVSAADGHVHELEIKQLKQLVKYKWLSLDEVDGIAAVSVIETTFDWLVQQSADYESCFTEFESYYQAHSSLFSKAMIRLTFHTAYAIADAFEGLNAAETAILKRLMTCLKN